MAADPYRTGRGRVTVGRAGGEGAGPGEGGVSAFKAQKYEHEAGQYWECVRSRRGPADAPAEASADAPADAPARPERSKFYRRNGRNFFKDRRWLANEFPELAAAALKGKAVLEVGCGVGNTVFPLLEGQPDCDVHCCDFSERAVELVREHELYRAAGGRVNAFVADLTKDRLRGRVPAAGVDLVTMVFVLSAISPAKMRAALRNVAEVLKPGGKVLFRDYAKGDLAEERFDGKQKSQKISDSFYVRGDGTRAFYFTEAGLDRLFEDCGFASDGVIVLHEREVENKKRCVARGASACAPGD